MNVIEGTVTAVKRHGHTYYGNPMMSVYIDGGSLFESGWYRISDNAGMVYAIENPEYREAPHMFAMTRSGRISHIVGRA